MSLHSRKLLSLRIPCPSKKAALSLMVAALSAASPALAQQEARAKGTSRLMEEVVVMAQKRTENAQDVPIALAAFTADKMDAMGIDDPKD